jgi:hypothetical protein
MSADFIYSHVVRIRSACIASPAATTDGHFLEAGEAGVHPGCPGVQPASKDCAVPVPGPHPPPVHRGGKLGCRASWASTSTASVASLCQQTPQPRSQQGHSWQQASQGKDYSAESGKGYRSLSRSHSMLLLRHQLCHCHVLQTQQMMAVANLPPRSSMQPTVSCWHTLSCTVVLLARSRSSVDQSPDVLPSANS